MATKYIVVRERKSENDQAEVIEEFEYSPDADDRAAEESRKEENAGYNIFVYVRRDV